MPQVGADSPGQSTAPALNEYMGRRDRRWQLVHCFSAHHGIPGHDCPWDISIARPGSVRDQQPIICCSILCCLAYRFTIVPRYAYNLGPERFNGALSTRAHFGMHINYAPAANVSSSPGNRSSVVAVGCGDDSDLASGFTQLTCHQSFNISCCTAPHRNFLGYRM